MLLCLPGIAGCGNMPEQFSILQRVAVGVDESS